MACYWVVVNVSFVTLKRARIKHPDFRESLFPNRWMKTKLTSGAICKSSLDELQRSLYRQITSDGDEDMKMIGHDDESVQAIFPLSAVVVKHFQKQLSGSSGLQNMTLPPNRGGYKERPITSNGARG